MTTTGPEHPAVSTDEDAGRPLAEGLRAQGFDVLTAGHAGLLGASDEQQLKYAASLGRALLSFNRRNFRRLHTRWQTERKPHAGIVLLPHEGPLARRTIRAAMPLYWLVTKRRARGLVNWGDLQPRLHRGERLVGYTEREVRMALGLA